MRILLALLLTASCPLAASVIYTDNFDSGAQLTWDSVRGDWTAGGGVYYATAPGNNPVTAALLPYDLTDFTATVDISGIGDGGLWLRSNAAATAGVVLVMHSHDIYWHIISDPSSGPWTVYNPAAHSDSAMTMTVTAIGSVLSAYIDGSATPVTTLDLSVSGIPGYDFSSGRFGFYSNSGISFDNLEIEAADVPEPASLALAGAGLALACVWRRRRA